MDQSEKHNFGGKWNWCFPGDCSSRQREQQQQQQQQQQTLLAKVIEHSIITGVAEQACGMCCR
jgi:hypothetical protein